MIASMALPRKGLRDGSPTLMDLFRIRKIRQEIQRSNRASKLEDAFSVLLCVGCSIVVVLYRFVHQSHNMSHGSVFLLVA